VSDLQERVESLRDRSPMDEYDFGYNNALDAVLDVITAHLTVTDEDALQILRGYWRDVGASFHDAEIKHVVELLEAFVARKLKSADRIEALEAELAEANAKIARVKEVADQNGRMTAELFKDDKPAYALYGYFEACLRTALSPKPTDNGGKE